MDSGRLFVLSSYMGKHRRKRQRATRDDAPEITPLGSATVLIDDVNKDDEERRLESLLFSKTFVSSTHPSPATFESSDSRVVGENPGGGLDNLLDSDLFYIDAAGPSTAPEDTADTFNTVAEAVWTDLDDQNIRVSLASDKRLRKLRDAPQEDAVGGRDYESRLRRQYEKVHPAPEWATNARQQLHKKKRRRASQSSAYENSDVEEGVTLLPSSSGALLASPQRRTLPKGQLALERLRDANQTARADGDVKSVIFHPSPSVPVLLTASSDRRLRLFNIDGHTNPHLQTVHIPSLPITTALFHPTGSSVLLTGHRPFYYTYDLRSGVCTRSPRGLWGNYASSPNGADRMEICAFSQSGDILAVAGRRGHVHLVDWRTGGGQVVGSVKTNAAVKDLWWTGGGKLMSLSEDEEVHLWDIGQLRCVRRWKDGGGFGSVIMTGGRGDAILAIGSKTGLVNLYGPESTVVDSSDVPKPLKTIGNLTTSISSMRFNHDAQILALASKAKKDQLKMVHVPSMTVFSNWPSVTTPLGHITSVDFSAGSEYAAFGNNRGRVLLYSLRHFTPV